MDDHDSRITATDIPPAPPLDHATRRLGVSASEIASVMGLSKYEDAFTVYQRKVGNLTQDDPIIDLSPARWGRAAESELLLAYCEVTGRRVDRPGTLTHPERPWQIATPDGLVREESRGVECKTADSRLSYLWGDPDKDEERDKIPSEYFLQCQYSMSVTGRPTWDVPALIGGNDFRIYTLTRDPQLEEMMLEAAHDFVFNHLKPGIPPPIGWSPASSEYLKQKYPEHMGTEHLPATEPVIALARRLFGLQEIEGRLAQLIEQTKNDLKLDLGSAPGFTHPTFKITWKKNRDGVKIDWQSIAREYELALRLIASLDFEMGPIEVAVSEALSAPARHTIKTQGARPFRATFHFKKAIETTAALAAAYKEIDPS